MSSTKGKFPILVFQLGPELPIEEPYVETADGLEVRDYENNVPKPISGIVAFIDTGTEAHQLDVDEALSPQGYRMFRGKLPATSEMVLDYSAYLRVTEIPAGKKKVNYGYYSKLTKIEKPTRTRSPVSERSLSLLRKITKED